MILAVGLITLSLATAAADAGAEADDLCGLEELSTSDRPCPPYITYDEEGEEVGGAEAGA